MNDEIKNLKIKIEDLEAAKNVLAKENEGYRKEIVSTKVDKEIKKFDVIND